MKYEHLLVAALALASFASGAMRIVPDFDPATAACPTINPPGTDCKENEECIRRGGKCSFENPNPPIVCKCVY